MRSKKGKVLPKKGKFLHQGGGKDGTEPGYADAIAAALRQELGTTHQAIKTTMRWTDASERTVKYWLSGSQGPCAEHLIALASRSDLVLEVFLRKAGRDSYVDALRLIKIRESLRRMVQTLQSIINDGAEP
jgi:hypothetical protein